VRLYTVSAENMELGEKLIKYAITRYCTLMKYQICTNKMRTS